MHTSTYSMTMNGTTVSETFAMRLTPPSSTSATTTVSKTPATTTARLYCPPNSVTAGAVSPNMLPTAAVMLFTCEKVPMPNRPTHIPSTAKMTARNFQRLPSPFSI